MGQIRWYGPSIVLVLASITVMLLGPAAARQIAYAHDAERIVLARESLTQSSVLTELSEAFTRVSEAVEPSVVKITVYARRAPGNNNIPRNIPDWFFGPNPQMPQQQPESDDYDQYNRLAPVGTGSGWVYDDQGHIITNNHVVQNAEEIRVEFANGQNVVVTKVGADPRTDIAVLKYDGTDIFPAQINTQHLRQGEMVFAFGSPLGFEFSMSQGIVSATDRTLGILRDQQGYVGYENFIQTDAAINRGNSGGPLTNVYGEVVGMNTAIASQSGGSNGVGFAIPSGLIVEVVDEIIQTGHVSRGFLGVRIKDVDNDIQKSYGLDSNHGIYIDSLIRNSPAAGQLEPEDIILEVEGKKVTDTDELRFAIARMDAGKPVDLTVWRDGKTIQVTVTLGELPQQGLASAQRPGGSDTDQTSAYDLLQKIGIEGVSLMRSREEGRDDVIIVTNVRSASIAAAEGITRGTRILQVQSEPVANVQEFNQQLEGIKPGDVIRMRIQGPRDPQDVSRMVFLPVPKD